MAYDKKGYNPNSLANLSKGCNMTKLMYADSTSQRIANIILDEDAEYNGEIMPAREAILRQQLIQALNGDLRSCQFLIELAEHNEQNASGIKTATVDPLEQLQQMMQKSKIDDRRRSKAR